MGTTTTVLGAVALMAIGGLSAPGEDLVEPVRDAGITGGLVAQVGSDDLPLEALGQYRLPACPVFDAMSAAGGKLLVPLVDGRVACFEDAALD